MKKLMTAIFALSAMTAFGTVTAPTSVDSNSTTVDVRAMISSVNGQSQLIITNVLEGKTNVPNIAINHGELSSSTLTKPSVTHYVKRTNSTPLFANDKNINSISFVLNDAQIQLGTEKYASKLITNLSVTQGAFNMQHNALAFTVTSAITADSFAAASAGEYTGSAILTVTVNN